MGRLLHADFIEFGASGRIWDAEAIVDSLATDVRQLRYVWSDLVSTRLSADTVLLTYRLLTEGAEGRRTSSLRSSVWLRHDGEWLLRFHQGTPSTGSGNVQEQGPHNVQE